MAAVVVPVRIYNLLLAFSNMLDDDADGILTLRLRLVRKYEKFGSWSWPWYSQYIYSSFMEVSNWELIFFLLYLEMISYVGYYSEWCIVIQWFLFDVFTGLLKTTPYHLQQLSSSIGKYIGPIASTIKPIRNIKRNSTKDGNNRI